MEVLRPASFSSCLCRGQDRWVFSKKPWDTRELLITYTHASWVFGYHWKPTESLAVSGGLHYGCGLCDMTCRRGTGIRFSPIIGRLFKDSGSGSPVQLGLVARKKGRPQAFVHFVWNGKEHRASMLEDFVTACYDFMVQVQRTVR